MVSTLEMHLSIDVESQIRPMKFNPRHLVIWTAVFSVLLAIGFALDEAGLVSFDELFTPMTAAARLLIN